MHYSLRIFLWSLAVILAYELYSHFTQRVPTLSRSIVAHIPEELVLTFLFWLFIHFLLRYERGF